MLLLEQQMSFQSEWTSDLMSIDNYVNVTLSCKKKKDLLYANYVHTKISEIGLDAHMVVGNFIVPMFVECENVYKAQMVFNRLEHKKEHSWTSLIQGLVSSNEPQEAIYLFQKMQEDLVVPSRHTLVALIKASSKLRWVDIGQGLNTMVAMGNYESDIFIGNALIDMYAKCGFLTDAIDIFFEMSDANVVTWTVMVAAYAQNGHYEQAIDCLELMEHKGVHPNSVTILSCLKLCCTEGSIALGRKLHLQTILEGFEMDLCIGNALVNMYAKCGHLFDACEVFEELPVHDVVSWTTLVTGYTEHGFYNEALDCFAQIEMKGLHPNAVTFSCGLRACASLGLLDKGKEMHTKIVQQGIQDFLVENTLMDMYAKCGALDEAREIFNEISGCDVISWNTLIGAYAENGFIEDALAFLSQMRVEGMSPNDATFSCILKGCICVEDLEVGLNMHGEIIKAGFETDSFVCNTLVNMYGKCRQLEEAHAVFSEFPVKNIVYWTTLITSSVELGLVEDALEYLAQMRLEGMSPNAVTLISILKAYSILQDVERGQEMHMKIVKIGIEDDPLIGNTLIDMYAKCALMADGENVFINLTVHDVILWNTVLSGYTEHGHSEKVLSLIEKMQSYNISPDEITFIYGLSACADLNMIVKGQELHAEMAKRGYQGHSSIFSYLINMYATCGLLVEAQNLFEKLPLHNDMSWNALIIGYAKQGHIDEAVHCFKSMEMDGFSPAAISWNVLLECYTAQGKGEKALELYMRMQNQGLWPDSVTFLCILKACSNMAYLEIGKRIHAQIPAISMNKSSITTTLIDMYGKCGSMKDAQYVFDESPMVRGIHVWTVLIAGYTRQGEGTYAFLLLDRMMKEGIQPDEVAFVIALTACSQVGLVHWGIKCFGYMTEVCGIAPTIEHYSCMVDLLGRAGQVESAICLLGKLPYRADSVAWSTVLAACCVWGNFEAGRHAFDCVEELTENQDGMYITMSNIYANGHLGNEANGIMAMRQK